MNIDGSPDYACCAGMTVNGKRQRDEENEQGNFKRLRVTEELAVGVSPTDFIFPNTRGLPGEVLVQQVDGTLDFETPASAGNAVLENVVIDVLNGGAFPSFATPIPSITSTNRFQYPFDIVKNRYVLLNDTPGNPFVWNTSDFAGSCFVYFTVALPILNPSDSHFVLRMTGRVGGVINGDSNATQDTNVHVWIQEYTFGPLPAADDTFVDLKNKFLNVIAPALEPTGDRTTVYSNGLGAQEEALYERYIDPKVWGGKTVNIGLWYKSTVSGSNAVETNGVYMTDMQLIARSRGNGVASLPPGMISHTQLLDIGTNTHAQVDTHIADNGIHWDGLTKSLNGGQQLQWDADPTRSLSYVAPFIESTAPLRVTAGVISVRPSAAFSTASMFLECKGANNNSDIYMLHDAAGLNGHLIQSDNATGNQVLRIRRALAGGGSDDIWTSDSGAGNAMTFHRYETHIGGEAHENKVSINDRLVISDGADMTIGSTSSVSNSKAIGILLKSAAIVAPIGTVVKIDATGYVTPVLAADPLTQPIIGTLLDPMTALGVDVRVAVGGVVRVIVADTEVVAQGNTLVKSTAEDGRVEADLLGTVAGAFAVALSAATGLPADTYVSAIFIKNDVA